MAEKAPWEVESEDESGAPWAAPEPIAEKQLNYVQRQNQRFLDVVGAPTAIGGMLGVRQGSAADIAAGIPERATRTALMTGGQLAEDVGIGISAAMPAVAAVAGPPLRIAGKAINWATGGDAAEAARVTGKKLGQFAKYATDKYQQYYNSQDSAGRANTEAALGGANALLTFYGWETFAKPGARAFGEMLRESPAGAATSAALKGVGGTATDVGANMTMARLALKQKDLERYGLDYDRIKKVIVDNDLVGNSAKTFHEKANEKIVTAATDLQKVIAADPSAKVNVLGIIEEAMNRAQAKTLTKKNATAKEFREIENELMATFGEDLGDIDLVKAQQLKREFGAQADWHGYHPQGNVQTGDAYNKMYDVLREQIEAAGGSDIKRLNGVMSDLIGLDRAAVKRMIVENRKSPISLTTTLALVGATASGHAAPLAIEAASLASRSPLVSGALGAVGKAASTLGEMVRPRGTPVTKAGMIVPATGAALGAAAGYGLEDDPAKELQSTIAGAALGGLGIKPALRAIGQTGRGAKRLGEMLGERGAVGGVAMPQDIRGSSATAILGGMTAGGLTGATAGAQIGNTPEERARNAMFLGGLGMVGGGGLGAGGAQGVVKAMQNLRSVPQFGIKVGRNVMADLRNDVVTVVENQAGSIGSWTNKSKQLLLAENAEKKLVPDDVMQKFIGDVDNVGKRVVDDIDLQYDPAANLSAVKDNADPNYRFSLDFSTLCRKRVAMINAIEATQLKLGRGLTPDEFLMVRKQLKEAGEEVSCGACYVESQRMFLGDEINRFIKKNPTVNKRLLLTTNGLDLLRRKQPEVYKEFRKRINARGIKTPELRTDYKGELLDIFGKNPKRIQEFNDRSGLRWQSWSDFELPHLMDGMQAIGDMSGVGLKGHAYTKVPEFVEAYGKTGMMINLSLIPKGRGLVNGKLVFDPIEGMPFEEAMRLRNKFSQTAGTVAIGTSDEHIRALLSSNQIDYILPYHRSGMSKTRRETFGEMAKWDDYTEIQHERVSPDKFPEIENTAANKGAEMLEFGGDPAKARKRAIDKYLEENAPRWAEYDGDAEKYLRLCSERGIVPKFEKFKDHPNYYKLLVDRKLYDNAGKYIDQKAVQPVFDSRVINNMLTKYKSAKGAGTKTLAELLN